MIQHSEPAALLVALLTKEELRKLCGVSKRTIDNWCAQRRIPFVKIGKIIRFDPGSVAEALQAYTVNSKARSAKL